ncbi:MAG: bifunctional adenosylcobinamide kinase/adenosylcobinamide-phosphate guanylyltransferase [Cyanobacteria bacterium]|nr:bifunctional adenosylcobinamide kinase/adenosylcobinamide-phosphate guanylyltransferase [Cyanobacteriota bacterium]MDA0865264.1 bifunctional adenosylcobinamide kinase/adenosylcobinamide-phosphate guanylyltransferase [Cyanobacteriota bacterium]
MALPPLILVTGPTRSGKSEWAESLALASGQSVVYVATAISNPADPEWQARLVAHRQRRPPGWRTLEVPVELAEALGTGNAQDYWVVDSLGTWLANGLDQSDPDWQQTQTQLLLALQQRRQAVVMVAEETGWGVVPAYPLGRTFRDRLGSLTRAVGAIADAVYLVVAGYAVDIRKLGQPVPTGDSLRNLTRS